MTVEKILNYAAITAGTALGLFLFPFVLKLFAPFILAFVVATSCQKIVDGLERKLHISRGISSALISTAVVAVGTALVLFAAVQIYAQAKSLIATLPSTLESLKVQLSGVLTRFEGYRHSLPKEISYAIDAMLGEISSSSMSKRAASVAVSAVGGVASALPDVVFFLSMFILGTFFFTKDYVLIINFLKELLPQKVFNRFVKVKSFFTRAFSLYLKAQFILMVLTAALVTVCLWIIGLRYPLLWGLIAGLVDALPLFGTAVVLVPLALVSLAYGDIYRFVGLIIVQIVVFLFRQLAEPKIVSHQIGIHPVLTLVGVYAGLRLFGVTGMIFAPVVMLLAVNLYVSYKQQEKF